MKGRIRWKGEDKVYEIDGRKVSEAEFYEAFPPQSLEGGVPGGPSPGAWPIHSEALGFHPEQREEATQEAIKRGVPTDIDGDGRPILRDRDHRRRYLKAFGFHDRNGGYGDG